MRRWIGIVSLLAFSGCSSLGPGTAQRYFVLEATPPVVATATSPSRPATVTLLIAPAGAASFYDTQEIVFSRAAGQRAYYQFSSWTEPPARSLDRLLATRLAATGAFGSVVSTTSGVRGTLELRTQLVEMFHDARAEPGDVRMRIDVELVDPVARRPVAQRTFVSTVPVRSANADGAVQAFDAATTALLDEIAAWVVAQASPVR